jgi:hypothetical protein
MTFFIGRREFITLLGVAAAAWPLAARAQQTGRTRRIGFLTSSSPVVSIESSYHAGLLRGMRELGYVVGKDFIVEWRFAEGKLERFAEFAAELGRRVCIRDADSSACCPAGDQQHSHRHGLFDLAAISLGWRVPKMTQCRNRWNC